MKSMNFSESLTGKRLVTLNVPMEVTEETVAYVARQLEYIVEGLEEGTGRRLEIESLRKTFECSNRTRGVMLKVNDLRTNPASPLTGRSAPDFLLSSHVL